MARTPTKGSAKKGTSPSRPAEKTVPRGRKVETPTSTGKGGTPATKKPGKGDMLSSATKKVRKS
jgi:hypothetical protein